MAKYNITWDKQAEDKAPDTSVILSMRTIKVTDAPDMSKADKIVFGYDKDQKVIAIKEYTPDDETAIPYEYAAKLKDGTATIHCQKFLEVAYKALGIDMQPKNRIKCNAFYDSKLKVLFAEIPQDK